MTVTKPTMMGGAAASLSRRNVLTWGAGAGAAAALSRAQWAKAMPSTGSPDAHFLLFVAIQDGVDNTYFFDERHPSLTDANKKANYLYKNDLSGSKTLSGDYTAAKVDGRTLRCDETNATAIRSPLVDPLYQKYGDRFSVVNGVYMIRDGFDGHTNNQAYLFTSSTTGGGNFFAPLAARGLTKRTGHAVPLDTTIFGSFLISPLPDNLASSVIFTAGDGSALGDTLKNGPKFTTASPLAAHLIARADASRAGGGLFARGAGYLGDALRQTEALGNALQNDIPRAGPSDAAAAAVSNGAATDSILPPALQALSFFKSGVTRVATILTFPPVDFHLGTDLQQNGLKEYTALADQLHGLFDLLATTVYREESRSGPKQTFLDVTTVMITSEFSRTNKQDIGTAADVANEAVGKTGTDHNRYSNSVILGGKGIRGGLVLGESDLRAVDASGAYQDVSGAHRTKEEKLNHIMGKPFDFATQRTRTDLPSVFDERDYICMPSVVNTVLSAFGVGSESYQKVGAIPAPLLTKVLA